jgi:beta-lactamase superfamily II metal-dependent hydrolase
MSYALLIRINQTKVLLAIDGKERTWNDIFENCQKDIKDIDILKASHHGQESGFHEKAVKQMNPKYIVFSNSQKNDRKYGASAKYQEAAPNATILKTCDHGTIIALCDWKGEIDFHDKYNQLIPVNYQ